MASVSGGLRQRDESSVGESASGGVAAAYELLCAGAARKQPVAAMMAAFRGGFARVFRAGSWETGVALSAMCLKTGRNRRPARYRRGQAQQSRVARGRFGAPKDPHTAKVASRKSRLRPTLIPETTRNTDSAAVASATDAPERCAAWRSSVGYAAPGGPGDPRGRKSAAGLEATNPRLPARAEGEKRFRSATRNP